MKQISFSEISKLALESKSNLAQEIKYCQEDWIKAKAVTIAGILTMRIDKTFYGEWPKGWKAQMKKEAEAQAKQNLISRFIETNCRMIDKVWWLSISA